MQPYVRDEMRLDVDWRVGNRLVKLSSPSFTMAYLAYIANPFTRDSRHALQWCRQDANDAGRVTADYVVRRRLRVKCTPVGHSEPTRSRIPPGNEEWLLCTCTHGAIV